MSVTDLLDRLDESVTVYDREARLIFLNAAAIKPFGRPVEELLGHAPWDLFPPAPPSPFRIALGRVLAGGPKAHVETYVEGLRRWYEVDIHPHPEGAVAIARDVTERKKRVSALEQSEARFRAMVEHAPEAIVIFDLDTGRFVDANGEAEKLFGRARDELLRLGPVGLSPPAQKDGRATEQFVAERSAQIQEKGSATFEWTALDGHGRQLLLDVRGRLLPGERPHLIRGSLFDVTRRRHLEEQLAQVQRLEAVAKLAGGVAHDFNNMLTVILGGIQLALADASLRDDTRETLAGVADAAERASLVTKQLLAFARKKSSSPRVLDLSAYVEGMKPVLSRVLGEDIELELDLARPCGHVLVDPVHVEQIVMNLVANGRDAMPRGGRITIHTANVLLDEEYERLHNGVPRGRYVMLTVADTGEGIPDAVKPHIFEPFFTTKSTERGTGLGLATVHGIVRQNQGHVWVYSEVGMGATFKVYLPLVEGTLAPEEARADAGRAPGGVETVLLVEDDDRVRSFLQRALQRAGYTVLEARNAGEALLLFEQHDEIALMVTDVVMPRMTGPALAARLRKIREALRVVYLSGYGEDRIGAPGDEAGHDGFLAKPVSVEALLSLVRAVLDG